MKKLKIRFVKFEKALAMQILEQEGLPKNKEVGNVWIKACPHLTRDRVFIRGSEKSKDFTLGLQEFESNKKRDDYLKRIRDKIMTELFMSAPEEPKVGEMVEVRSEARDEWEYYNYKLIAILPENCASRFITEYPCPMGWMGWNYARPIVKYIEPKIERLSDNDIIYTWEEE